MNILTAGSMGWQGVILPALTTLAFGDWHDAKTLSHAVQYLTRPVSFFLKSSSRCKTWSIFASSSADRKLKSRRSRNSVLGFMSGCCSFHLLLALVRQFPQTFSPLQRSSPIRRLCVHCEHKTQQSCQTESKEPCTHTEWATGWSCFCFVFFPLRRILIFRSPHWTELAKWRGVKLHMRRREIQDQRVHAASSVVKFRMH